MGVIVCILGCMLRSDTLQITPEILSLIARVDEFKGAWRALGTLAPERLSALRRVATIESIGSSTRIEGGRLSDRDVERLLAAPDTTTPRGLRDKALIELLYATGLRVSEACGLDTTDIDRGRYGVPMVLVSGKLAARRIADFAVERGR